MSFDIYNKKPKLIEPRIFNYYNERNKAKELKETIKKQELAKIEMIDNEKWYKKLLENIWNFIKDNYGFFLMVTLIILLLYVRYIEVNARKKKMKEVIDKINKEKEIKQYLELQEINKQLENYE
jgi:predicted PurR-regulated permease PerM